MRHLKAGNRLGVTTSHRRAMMRNLVTSLLENGRIRTTLARAKAMRKDLDKMIGFGKRGDLHARRMALRFIKSKEAMQKLFDEYAPLYMERNGGYSRIYKLNNRLGDNAKMALIQLVGFEEKEEIPQTSKAAKSSKLAKETVASKPEKNTLEEVKEELTAETKVSEEESQKEGEAEKEE